MMHLWSAKLAWPSPHLRWCEALQRHVDLVEIKGLRIKLTPYPFEHLLVLGVLWSVDGFQETGVAPDATTILGGTGPFAREADGVALPLVQRQYLFNEELVFPAIPKIVLIEQLGLLAPHQGRQAHGTRVFRIPLAHHARITIGDATTNKLIQVRALPPHHALEDAVELHQCAITRDLHPPPDRRLTPLQGDFDLIHDTCCCPLCPSHVLSSCVVTARVPLSHSLLFQPVVMMQAAQDWPRHHAPVLGKVAPVCLQHHGQWWRWLRYAWPQSHMGTACIIMRDPCVHDASHVVLGERDHKIQAFPPQGTDEPLAECIGLRRPCRRLAHPQPQVADALVKLLREDAIAVM